MAQAAITTFPEGEVRKTIIGDNYVDQQERGSSNVSEYEVDIENAPEKSWKRPKFLSEDLSPIQLFEPFIDEVLEVIVQNTVLFTCQKSDITFNFTPQVLIVVIAIFQ